MSFDISFGSASSLDDMFDTKSLTPFRKRIANVNDVPGFMKISSDSLIHIAQQDFWAIKYDEAGQPFIERLVEDQVRG
jgi:hypothetical protein